MRSRISDIYEEKLSILTDAKKDDGIVYFVADLFYK